ncbi:PhzF family phenazine biosynthesis isomerase [Streptomyces sparsogenes]|uniref:PhzF family phenazine biosynthesis protein n=1 Tax=Streptomyces sparsogenes TaxID=67365 RepID=UPI0033EB533A
MTAHTAPAAPTAPAPGTDAPGTDDVLHYSAFTTDPSGGNPAGVVLDAAALDDARMVAIAARVGYSETAFITSRDEAARRYGLRYFSPRAEVAFCGHATIATAVALAERTGPGELVFDTPVGEIRVATTLADGTDGTDGADGADGADGDGSAPQATLTSAPAHSRPADEALTEQVLKALRWTRDDLDPALPPHIAFAGNDHFVLAAATRERLADLDYDFDALEELMHRHEWTTVHLVWRESADRFDFHARDPFPPGGVVEDPATGAAAAAFGGYLRALGLITEPTRVRIRQGEDMGRPSELLVDLTPDDDRSRVTGRAVRIPGA